MIAVSIVTYNTDVTELGVCLDCVTSCCGISRIDIIDNSSQANICDFVKGNYPQVNYIANANTGYGAANNLSMRRSLCDPGTKYHLVINTDIVFEPDVLARLAEYMEADDRIGLIMPAVTNLDGTPQSCCHRLPSPIDLLLHRFTPRSVFRKWRACYEIIPQNYDRPLNVPYMHGCFMLFKVDALITTGLFDEKFFMYPEDIDMTRRMHRDYKTIVMPCVSIIHAHRADSRHSLRMLWIHATNMLKYFAKWGFFFDGERRRFNNELKNQLSI